MIEIQSPNSIFPLKEVNIFLAGSIEMGKAEDWQTTTVKAFENYNIGIFNPRRKDWDSTWKQEINNPQFKQQVDWELDALDFSNIILMYFQPETMSPISLLELGRHLNDKKLVVVCPEGFWRKGNIDIVCQRYNIPQFNTLDEAINYIKLKL